MKFNTELAKKYEARRKRHLASQKIYAEMKTENNKRCCVWIPREREDEFRVSMKRLRKKWDKGGA